MNGEIVQSTWIFYSQSLGKMFCIYCKFFGEKSTSLFTQSGFSDWKHTNLIANHEKSTSHFASARLYAQKLSQSGAIHLQLTNQLQAKINYWQDILKRILSVIRFLASRDLPIRGSNQKVGNFHNGNYLGLLELISEYDALLQTHIEKLGNKGKGHVSYLSANIAEEFIHLIACEIRTRIVHNIQQSKYFALITDSTPDVSHVDQLIIVYRYLEIDGSAHEKFFTFLPNVGHKGVEMETSVLDSLEKSQIAIRDCRGQAYDNASNMSGKYKGFRPESEQSILWSCTCHAVHIS